MTRSRELSGVASRVRGRLEPLRAPVVHFLDRSNAREIENVRWFTRHLKWPGVRPFALAANRVSNGSLYIMIGGLFWLSYGNTSAVAGAATALAVGHLIYPVIKRHSCRRRPFQFDASVPSLLPPLDKYSFPSGHMMSCVAVMTPLCVVVPTILPWLIVTLLIIGWARSVAGHHYPSDLLAGGVLGLIVALPIVAMQMSYA